MINNYSYQQITQRHVHGNFGILDEEYMKGILQALYIKELIKYRNNLLNKLINKHV